MFTQVSAGIAHRPQVLTCPGSMLGCSTLRQTILSTGGFSVNLERDEYSSVATAFRGRQCCSFSSSELEKQPEGQPNQKLDKKVLKTTIYDSLEKEKITAELFPELNFPLDGNYYLKLLTLVVKKINTFLGEVGGEKQIPELLEGLGLKLNPHIVGEVLKSQKDPQRMHRFFEWAGNQPGFQHTSHTYNLRFWNLVSIKNDKPGNLMLAIIFLEEMVAKNMNPGIYACNVLVDRLCKDRKVGAALRLSEELDTKDFPDRITFNTLINGLCKAGLFKEMFDLVEKMKKKGFVPNDVTYNSIIHGLGNAGQWQEAWKIFDELPENGITPNVITYNSLIFGLFKSGQLDQLSKVYILMTQRGCEPNLVTYNTFIDGYAKTGHLDEACKVFDFIKLKGYQPDVITWNTLISGMISRGNMTEASRLLTEMAEMGCRPNAVTYKLLGLLDQQEENSLVSNDMELLNNVLANSDKSGERENEYRGRGGGSGDKMKSQMQVLHT